MGFLIVQIRSTALVLEPKWHQPLAVISCATKVLQYSPVRYCTTKTSHFGALLIVNTFSSKFVASALVYVLTYFLPSAQLPTA